VWHDARRPAERTLRLPQPHHTEHLMSTIAIHWSTNVDEVLASGKRAQTPILLDFTAAPQ
jgi:hypothetical protein